MPSRFSRALVRTALGAIAFATALTHPLAAQVIVPLPDDPPTRIGDASDRAAAAALILSPIAGLPFGGDYMLSRPGQSPRPARYALRYGAVERGPGVDQHGVAAGAEFAAAGMSIALDAGYLSYRCDDSSSVRCKGLGTIGARAGRSFHSWSMNAAGTSAVIVGAEASVAASRGRVFETRDPENTLTVFAASAALPVAVPVTVGRVTVAPVLAPRLAYGTIRVELGDESDTDGGVRAQLGGSLLVRLGSHLGLDFGLQRVFVPGAVTMYGAAASYAF